MEFTASKVSGDGNAVFPNKIIIDDEYVIYRKSRVIGRKDIKFSHEAMSCVTLNKYMLFADINTDTSSSGQRYDLQGRPVGPGYRGIYILDGRKYIACKNILITKASHKVSRLRYLSYICRQIGNNPQHFGKSL